MWAEMKWGGNKMTKEKRSVEIQKKQRWGSVAVAFAYVCWGLLTVFWNLLAEINAVYILAQRILWSMVFMGIYMTVMGKWKEIFYVFCDFRKIGVCFICGILITINWGVYIYAVNNGHVLDASLGYFIEPILVASIGMLIFHEKLSAMEKVTFWFAAAGLLYMIFVKKTFPALALLIAGSFAVYGAVKKKLDLTPHASLFMETLCMTPLALIFIIYAEMHGLGSSGILHETQFLLLPATGIITSVPLLLFNIGVREIPYYLSGIFMYINPTLQFLMGIFYFHEGIDVQRLTAFVIIWIGILFTIYEKGKIMKRSRLTHG